MSNYKISPKNRLKLIIFLIVILGIVIGSTIGVYFGKPERASSHIWSGTVTLNAWGRVHLEVTPTKYPVEGEFWTISVYSTNVTSGGVSLIPLANSKVEITVKEGESSKIYYRTSDNEGKAEFQYLPSYSDVAFQAFSEEYESAKIIISEHFVSSNIIEIMLMVNGFFTAATTLAMKLAGTKSRIRKALISLFISLIFIFGIISIFSFYSLLFLDTPWGFPEMIVEPYITLTFLKELTVIGVALFFTLAISAIIITSKQTKKIQIDNS